MISLISLIFMFTLVPTIFASCCKLSAYLLRRRVVGWKQCFIFACIFVLFNIIVNAIMTIGGFAFPPLVWIILAFIAETGIGSWYFSSRATYANGKHLSWRGGAELTALSLIFIATIGIVLLTGEDYFQTLTRVLSR
jgi:hypothetical protein